MITLDLQTFCQDREDGNVTGVIFLKLSDGAFPKKEWSDFPVIILGWWIDAWLQFTVPTRHQVNWRFMDGPHSVTLVKTTDTNSDDAFDPRQVQSCLLEAAQRVLTHCQHHRLQNKDLKDLSEAVQRLKTNQGMHAKTRCLFHLNL